MGRISLIEEVIRDLVLGRPDQVEGGEKYERENEVLFDILHRNIAVEEKMELLIQLSEEQIAD